RLRSRHFEEIKTASSQQGWFFNTPGSAGKKHVYYG
ncbi:hypothetical protein, partial [Bacillus phage SPG24]